MTDTLTVALWATNMSARLDGLDAWAGEVDAQLAEARTAGARLLAMPEYMSLQWLSFAPAGLTPAEEIPWMASQAEAALSRLRPLVARHGIALLAGTTPVVKPDPAPGEPPHLNRAWLLLPDGREIVQDKLCLTPGEKSPLDWNLTTGDALEIVEWDGLRLAVLICLDVELPALAARLAPAELDLILVPSQTAKLAGYARVFSCAKARAIELQAAVCAVGGIGRAAGPSALANTSGAAAYIPCEEVLGHDGVLASLPPRDRTEGPGPMLIARDLPIAEIRRLRRGGAEVWPGAWRADHVRIGPA
jgi:predicted amidohydrolase